MPKYVAGVFLVALIAVTGSQTSFAQSNVNTRVYNYSNASPGVLAAIDVTTETLSEDVGKVTITGHLNYGFSPKPKNITFTLKNIDGKGAYSGSIDTKTTSTLNAISIVFNNFPIDKSSKTKKQATSDRLLLTSAVDNGTDYFFSGGNTYINFEPFQQIQGTPPVSSVPPFTVFTPNNKARTQSLVITSSKLVGPSKTTTSVDVAGLSLVPNNHYTPLYVGLALVGPDDKIFEYSVDSWREIQDPNSPRYDGMVLGASKHTFKVEKGKIYSAKAWASTDASTQPYNGEDLGTFLLDANYLFGKKISNTAPELAPVDPNAANVWNSLTGTFNPGDIEFLKINPSDGLSATDKKEAYIFLSKIPGLANTKKLGSDGVWYDAFDPTIEGSFGKYIGIFINMIYGIIALLAVFNIIRYGIDLMVSSATPFKVKENKAMIWNSFIALAIALGSYLLLYTINPKLTSWNVGVTQTAVDGVELDTQPMTSNDPAPAPGTPVAKCPEGIVTISTSGGTFPACKSISAKLKTMIDLAWSEGYKIYGYGFRSKDKQVALRKQNCGGDTEYNIYKKPSGQCKPPTAIPGTSMHESGLAFDLTCDGLTIRAKDNKCFIWLQKNAGKHGLKNLPSEPWHWSTTGG